MFSKSRFGLSEEICMYNVHVLKSLLVYVQSINYCMILQKKERKRIVVSSEVKDVGMDNPTRPKNHHLVGKPQERESLRMIKMTVLETRRSHGS